MKKVITSISMLLSTTVVVSAQTTATNWTAQDCNSASHTLFTELDAGKIVVFSWVMPCGSCVNPSKTAYNVVQSYAATNPGKVVFYLADDLGDDNCTALTNWVTTNNVGTASNMTIFGNSGATINENDFGGSGMPHVVVMAGTDHKILFNKKNAAANDAAGMQAAINTGLTLSVNDVKNVISFSISPNPASDEVAIKYLHAIEKVTISTVTGQTVKEEIYGNGKINPTINLDGIAAGVYVVKVIDVDGKSGIQKIVKQ